VGSLVDTARELAPLVALVAIPVALLWMVLLIARRRTDTRGRRVLRTATADALLLISVAAILLVTVRPLAGVDWAIGGVTLMPFEDLIRSLGPGMPRGAVDRALSNLLGNVLLFVPFGVALGLRFPTTPLWRLLAACVAFSVAIEVVQMIPRIERASDVTDVLMNTLGGAIGAAGARAFVLAIRRSDSHPS
jgi:glycopeptide antibiotics resistance protein